MMQIGSYETGRVYQGDCLRLMKALPDNRVDTICTDPPYFLGFMGKEFDKQDGADNDPKKAQERHRAWATEALRVAKPGAMLLAFGGTRTSHRLACAIEDAGWEIRDTIMWVFGSGFPKSLDISKAIDKAAGAEREVIGTKRSGCRAAREGGGLVGSPVNEEAKHQPITAPSTDEAKKWDGWGSALKPAWEPIVVAMKPLDGTFAENAQKWGVAGLWIDGGRVGIDDDERSTINNRSGSDDGHRDGIYNEGVGKRETGKRFKSSPAGRWPPNLIHDGSRDVTDLFPDQSSGGTPPSRTRDKTRSSYGRFDGQENPNGIGGSSGSAARFFYSAKTSRRERKVGLIGHIPCVKCGELNSEFHLDENGDLVSCVRNSHPTVKPLALMRYLVRLTKTPTGGLVLDPFAGSGTTGMACRIEGREFIGFEKEAEYVEIANRRIPAAFDALEPDPGKRKPIKDRPGQGLLFEDAP